MESFPPLLSGLFKTSRFMIIRKAMEISDRTQSRYCIDELGAIIDRFMVRGTHGPVQWIIDLRAYGLKIFYRQTAQGNINWAGDTLMYKTVEFRMPESLKGVIHGLTEKTNGILHEKILFTGREKLPGFE